MVIPMSRNYLCFGTGKRLRHSHGKFDFSGLELETGTTNEESVLRRRQRLSEVWTTPHPPWNFLPVDRLVAHEG